MNNSELITLLAKVEELVTESNKTKNEVYEEIRNDVNNLIASISKESVAQHAINEVDEILRKKYGALPDVINLQIKNNTPKKIIGLFHKEFKNILNLLLAKKNVLLVGESGAGKNVLGKQLAESLGVDFYCTPAIKDEFKLSGFIDANGKQVETPFYKAWSNGGVYLLDELDASNPNAILELNAALANGYFEFPNGLKEKHEDFYIIAAANTVGIGGDKFYTAREELDASTIDRFVVVDFNIDPNLERKIAKHDFIYDFVVNARNSLKERGLRYIISMRATEDLSDLYGLFPDEYILKAALFKNMTNEDIRNIYDGMPNMSSNPFYTALKRMVG